MFDCPFNSLIPDCRLSKGLDTLADFALERGVERLTVVDEDVWYLDLEATDIELKMSLKLGT